MFVGSLKDDNIKKLVAEANRAHTTFGVQHSRLGTIIDLDVAETAVGENPVRLGLRRSSDTSVAESAHRLQVLLDYVLWLATNDEPSWLLDERYASLHADDEREVADSLRQLPIPTSGTWPVVTQGLQRFGRRASAVDQALLGSRRSG